MRNYLIIIVVIVVSLLSLNLSYSSGMLDNIKILSRTAYIGTYVKDSKPNSTYNVVISINENGKGESYVTNRHMPYKGKFTWVHSYNEGMSSIKCTWENPIYEKNEMMEYFIDAGMYEKNQMEFLLTGIDPFKDSKPGILLTPVMTKDGLIMGEVAQKINGLTYDFK